MPRTKGSQSEVGMLYQYGVTALLATQLSRDDQVADYIIYSSEKSAGKFDDIVARMKLKEQDDWYLYLIQVKYKATKKLNVSDSLKGKRIEYFLSDYIKCFNDILNNPYLICRQGIPNDNIRFNIFCDKGIQMPVFLRQDCTFQLSVCRNSEKSDLKNNVLFPFGNKYWKFVCKDLEKSEFQHFFDKCYLYVDQPNYSKLSKLIEETCRIKNTKEIINYVKDYFNDDDLYKQGLSKEVFEIELQKIRLIDAIPPLTSLTDLIDDNRIAIWNEITINHDITAVNCMQNFDIEPYLYSCLVRKINTLLDINIDWKTCFSKGNYLDNELIEKFLIYSKTKPLRYWIDPPNTIRLLILELWKCGDLPLIVKTRIPLNKFERYSSLNRSYIILDDWTNRSEEITTCKMEVFTSLSSITNPKLQDRILEEIVVSPQGRKPMTLKNLLRDDKELTSTFTCVDILRMMRKRTPFLREGYYKGCDYLAFIIEDEGCAKISDRIEPYAIGHNVRISCPPGQTDECIKMIRGRADISQHYTIYHLRKTGKRLVLTQGDPQKLNHRFVDQYGEPLFIANTGECIPIIGQTIELNELRYITRQLRRVTLPRSFFSAKETQICILSGDVDFMGRSVEFSNIDDVINKTISIEKKPYFVKIHKNENRQYYWRKLCHLRYPIFDIYSRDGRLELLRYKNCKNLNAHISYDGGVYSEQEFFNEIRDESDEIVVVTGDAGIGKTSFLKWLCNNYSTQDYIIFYDLINLQVDLNKSKRQRIDLLDFIFKESQNSLPKQYTNFVSNLRRKKKLIWVLDSFDEIRLACEKEVLDLIRIIANSGVQVIIATRIENCNVLMDQFEIRLIKIEPLEEKDCHSYWELNQDLLANISSELATNPLYLNFLKVISINREELVNITKYTLYEKIINMKINHCLRTTYQILHDSDIERAVLLFERLALVVLFGKKVIEEELYWMCDNEVFDMTKFGIVIRFDEDGYPMFYHRSFVEFLFAQWIAKAYQINIYKNAARHLYKQLFNENKLHILNILFEDKKLHNAVLQRNIAKIKKIVKENAECWNLVDKLGRTALHAAVIYNTRSHVLMAILEVMVFVVTSMLQNNLDMDTPDSIMNWNWADYIQTEIFDLTYSLKKMEIVRIYLRLHRKKIEKYNCPSPVFPSKGFYPIFLWALKVSAIDVISDLVLLQNFENKIFYCFYKCCLGLVPEKVSLCTTDFYFEGHLTPLHVGCIYGSVSMIQHLIQMNCYKDAVDAFGCTPLHYSIMRCSLLRREDSYGRRKNVEAVRLLLKAGADPNLTIRNDGVTPLYLAVQTKDVDVVLMLLQFKAGIPARLQNQDTLLHLAVNLGCVDIVRCLLNYGVPRYFKNKQNETALDIAVKQNNTEMIELLSEKEVVGDIEGDKMRAVYVGSMMYRYAEDTPLHTAVSRGNIDHIKVLLRRGEDINVLDKGGCTPLLAALRIRNIKVSTYLLSKGADIHIQDKYGVTALMAATLCDNIRAIEMILERGGSTNIAPLCNSTPLHVAIKDNNLHIAKLLLEKGANPNAQDLKGDTPLCMAVENGYKDSVTLLLENGANQNISDRQGRTPLLRSILSQQKEISMLLLQKEASVNARDNRNRTPLLAAVHLEDIDIVRLLLEKGAEVNDEDIDGGTPLIIASRSGNTDLVRLLVGKGANINALNKSGNSALWIAAHYKQINIIKLLLEENVDIDQKGGTAALSCFISERDINTVSLLLRKGACVNAYEEGYGSSLLHLAASKGDADIVGLLLENGAHVNSNCGEWPTPLYQAVVKKHQHIVKLLIDKGANGNSSLVAAIKTKDVTIVELILESNTDITSEVKLAALNCAISLGNIKIIKLLLNKGIDLNIYNEHDDTPLYTATAEKHADIVGLLLENGADVNIETRNGVIPFAKAVLDGHIEITRLLLDNGANVNNRFGDGTALHLKTEEGDVDFVKLLIEKGADANIRTKDGITAREIAVNCGYTSIVEVLQEGRADVNTQTLDGADVHSRKIVLRREWGYAHRAVS